MSTGESQDEAALQYALEELQDLAQKSGLSGNEVTALLELMKVRYTGSGPDALLLCKDKALAKKVLTYHRVRQPHFLVSHRERPLRRLKRFTFPAFVNVSSRTLKCFWSSRKHSI